MLRRLTVLLLLGVGSRLANSQVAGVSEEKMQTLSGWKVRIENLDPNGLVAFTHVTKCPADDTHRRSEMAYRFDPLFNYGSDKTIEPGAFHGFSISPQVSDCPGGIVAAIFSDGHSVGDPEAIKDIYRRRLGAQTAIAYALPFLEKMSSGELLPVDVQKQLREHTGKVSLDESKLIAERQGETYVYGLLISCLNVQRAWKVPSDSAAKKQPGIEEVMKVRNLPLPQALGVVLHRKLAEWNDDLQGNITH